MGRSNYALNAPESILAAARRAAKRDGVRLNQFINTALAEMQSLDLPSIRGARRHSRLRRRCHRAGNQRQDHHDPPDRTGFAKKILYYEEDDILFLELAKGEVVRDESASWNVNIGYTADGIGEITILDAQESGIYPLQIERVAADVA
jgi:hypothetical protein